MADALVDAGVVLILSSGAARCVETVAPLAERLGLEVGTAEELFEGSDPESAWTFLAQCADDDGDVVLCSHGDVIPDLIRRAQLRGMEIPGRSGCSKGSRWTLTGWDGERFARGDYEPNPA